MFTGTGQCNIITCAFYFVTQNISSSHVVSTALHSEVVLKILFAGKALHKFTYATSFTFIYMALVFHSYLRSSSSYTNLFYRASI